MSVLADLAALQEVDSQRDELITRTRELQRLIADDPHLTERQQLRAAVQQALREHRLIQARIEGEIATEQEQITRREELLRSPSIQDEHSYLAVQQELDHHRNHTHDLEDALLATLEDVEVTDRRLADLDREIAALEAGRVEQIKVWKKELQSIVTAGRGIEAERVRRVAPIPADTLQHYERLRREKGGRAVSVVQGHMCGACRLTLSAGTFTRVRGGGFVHCDHCGRLLYLP